ncbi:MAG: bifunctional nuclease family protein [Candidatus Methanoculleus thermohydrogenotrophicum]|jgi:bifunctional DNase/RNase|nr:bifunctional nuclease family protein [Candidatus Methanoculleus thermohydrogenotrophicum]HPZ37504.1 bifunctional nuclease family protein [Candidatus Methanoculleus thermohydrogenotrophicum]HQC90956.1 bifunctional nuclease family protein [Candidatus Methanoculleus thermohydrogenotrophicum]
MTAQSCRVRGVFMSVSEMGAAPTVVLDAGGDSTIPIYVGLWEAISINNALINEMLPRPITHDLVVDLFRRFDITLDALHIDSLEEGVFYAKLHLSQGSRTEIIDCRPSDGIAIALRYEAPIMIEDTVVASAAVKKDDLPKMVDLKEYL